MVLRLITCSPRRSGFVCHRRPADDGFVRPVGLATPPRALTPTMRRQDHTLLPYAHAPFVLREGYAHGTYPPCDFVSRRRCRVHRIPSRVRDVGQRPSYRERTRRACRDICPTSQAEYFCAKGWTGFRAICPAGCFLSHAGRDISLVWGATQFAGRHFSVRELRELGCTKAPRQCSLSHPGRSPGLTATYDAHLRSPDCSLRQRTATKTGGCWQRF